MQSNIIPLFKGSYPTERMITTFIAGCASLALLICNAAMAEEPVAKTSSELQQATGEQEPDPDKKVFATVGDINILMRDFKLQYALIERERYYHAKVQEHLVGEFQREIRDILIEKALLRIEVKRRADPVNAEELKLRLDDSMAQFDERFGKSEIYQKEREIFKGGIKDQITAQMRVRDLEKKIRDSVVDPGDDVLKQYYQQNLELFTQPGQYRLSVILLGVDPSSGVQAVLDTVEEAKGLVEALRNGNADFAEMAEAISADKSAVNGGDMGYQHQGMLAPGVEAVLDDMSEGDISEPVRVLEGISIFKMDDKVLPNVQPFDLVRERVLGLWLRENKDKAWNDFITGLKENTKIVVYDDFFEPLPEGEGEQS